MTYQVKQPQIMQMPLIQQPVQNTYWPSHQVKQPQVVTTTAPALQQNQTFQVPAALLQQISQQPGGLGGLQVKILKNPTAGAGDAGFVTCQL